MHKAFVMFALFIGLVAGRAYAQEFEVGVQGGASGYMGDLNPENPLAYNDWGAGIMVKYNINHTWGIRANLNYANIGANDADSKVEQRQQRGLSFFGHVTEASLVADFNFFRWLPQRGRVVYTPYIFAGIAGIQFEPKGYLPSNGKEVKLRDVMTEQDANGTSTSYGKYALAIPFGVGFKYNLRGPWSVGVEIGYRLALTDYLDDVSGFYPTPGSEGTPPKNVTAADWPDDWHKLAFGGLSTASPLPSGTQRGDGRPYDSYMTAGITLSYTIFRGGCPEWR